jgi:beta-glucosidase
MSTYIECGFLDDPSDPDYHQEVGAALWIGAPGDTGIRALGRILKGEVNPSGSLVDTFVKDLTADPAYQNFGDNMSAGGDMYTNVSDKSGGYIYAFVDYEEGVYSGYRYWETRALTDGEQWYKDHVVYPFGYGLSYTTFEQGIKSVSGGISKGSVISVDVEVKNTGSVAGKKSVQLYISAPYTAGGIEKPGVELAGFAKTPEIAPGASKTVTIEIDPYLFASYDYNDKNGNGFSGYELEKGAYVLSLRDNAHSEIESRELSLASDILYETDEASGYNVVNRYEDADDEIETTMMSRSDFEGTFPKSRTDAEKVISVATKSGIDSLDSLSPAKYKEFPQYGAEGQYEFYNLINAAYDDPRWEELLNRVTYDEMVELINVGAFNTAYVASIKKPKTIDSDGPAGFAVFLGGGDTVFGTSHYACEPVIAATFNTELAEEMGEAVGEEALIGNGQTPYSGWYAPGLNIHRTAFGGRVGEYFSEDPLLSGLIGASEITGASTKGVYAYIKHFAVNEQETSRNGVATWLSEQALRQIYLRPFELVVKKGKATAIMTSFNRIGTKWTGGDYRLLTEILRNEWGFKGTVITDFNTHPFMDIGQMLSAGGDLNLAFLKEVYKPRKSDATALTELRMATKNILYTVSRSNAIPIEGYSMPIWDIALIIGVCVAGVGFAVWGFFVISSELKKKKLGQGQ